MKSQEKTDRFFWMIFVFFVTILLFGCGGQSSPPSKLSDPRKQYIDTLSIGFGWDTMYIDSLTLEDGQLIIFQRNQPDPTQPLGLKRNPSKYWEYWYSGDSVDMNDWGVLAMDSVTGKQRVIMKSALSQRWQYSILRDTQVTTLAVSDFDPFLIMPLDSGRLYEFEARLLTLSSTGSSGVRTGLVGTTGAASGSIQGYSGEFINNTGEGLYVRLSDTISLSNTSHPIIDNIPIVSVSKMTATIRTTGVDTVKVYFTSENFGTPVYMMPDSYLRKRIIE